MVDGTARFMRNGRPGSWQSSTSRSEPSLGPSRGHGLMAADTSQPTDGSENNGTHRQEDAFGDTAVIGRRMRLMDVLAAVLFAGVLLAVVFAGEAGVLLYVLVPIVLLNLWACLTLFVRRPRAAIKDGVFSLRLIPTWRASAGNVASVELLVGKMAITFRNVAGVQPREQRSALSRHFKRHGYHLITARGVFSLEQVNELRAALGMPLQEQDRFADFEATLDGLTPRIIVTPALIALNVGVFLVMVLAGANVLKPNIPVMLQWGANYGPLTTNGQWWRLLSGTFLHFGVIHLLVNMWVLRDVGREVERLVGSTGFLIGYLVSGFFGSLASVFWQEAAVSAGASGAVFGVFGMLLGFVVLRKGSIPVEALRDRAGGAIAFLIFNLIVGLSVPWIDQAAHIGGFIAGCVCGLVLSCDVSVAAVERKFRDLALAVSAPVLAVFLVLVLPARSPDLGSVGAQVDEVDATAVATYQDACKAVQSGEQTRTEAAGQIAHEIVPAYVALADRLKQVAPRNEKQKRAKAALVEYVRLRREGWELAAEALENDDIVREGLAIEKFEGARTTLADVKASAGAGQTDLATDLRTELAVFSVAEARAYEVYGDLLQRFSQGDVSGQELAESIERDVLPVWDGGRYRFISAAESFSPANQPLVLRIRKYMELQREGWLLQAGALRSGDEAMEARSREKLEEAARAGMAIWQSPAAAEN
jgi:rhomboid protease GluP